MTKGPTNPNGSNTVATFLRTFRFVTGSSVDLFEAEIVNVSSVLFQEIPSVLTTGSCPTVIGHSVVLLASGVAATTSREV